MIIIRIFCNWNKETSDCFIKFNELDKDPDYNIKYKLTDTNNYTHVLFLNNYTIEPSNSSLFNMTNIIAKNNIIY